MAILAGTQEPKAVWELPPALPLNELAWKAWLAKGAALDRESTASVFSAVHGLVAALLLVTGALWPQLAPNTEALLRFAVTAGSIVVMARAIQMKSYAAAVVFAAVAIAYNPVSPLFGLSGNWQRALVITSAVPFLASFWWRRERQASHA